MNNLTRQTQALKAASALFLICACAPAVHAQAPTPPFIVFPVPTPVPGTAYGGRFVETAVDGSVLRGTLSILIESDTNAIKGQVVFSSTDTRPVDGKFTPAGGAAGWRGSGYLNVRNPDGTLTVLAIHVTRLGKAFGGAVDALGRTAAFRLSLELRAL